MVDVKTIELLIRLISFSFAYVLVSTIPSAIRSRVATYFGDDTSEQLGLSSFNPVNHLDIVGFLVLMFSTVWGSLIGWGRNLITNPFGVYGPYKKLKLIVIYYTDVVVHFLMACIGIIIFVVIFKNHVKDFAYFISVDEYMPSVAPDISGLIDLMLMYRFMSNTFLVKAFPHVSSFHVIIGFISIAAAYLHIVLGVLYMILNTRELYMLFSSDEDDIAAYEQMRSGASTFFVPLLLLFFLAEPLRELVVRVITMIAIALAAII
ncbi:hypothetical protein IPH25_01580 [bacterium]|nr:MAG: hypothetical protein IPG37_03710 [bacterium]QQR62117.1 MAG: hypothetical protein IPH25_01580 [bacterium]QQR63324.1 MAG: hypothetical protein IPH67_02530 [bacterium]